jgi:methylmalonyl-CoA mutase
MKKIKVLTAAALFDGHDVSINLFRRLLQKRGAEVVHLGHNRSVREVTTAALQEDVDAILISSYQGGHNEYFKYLVDLLRENGAGNKLVFGGGGGVILPEEIQALEEYGVTRIYHASDGQKIGIDGISDDIIARITSAIESKVIATEEPTAQLISNNDISHSYSLSKQITFFDTNIENDALLNKYREIYKNSDKKKSFVLGVTGTGGAGKSSLIDEIIGKFLTFTEKLTVGILAVDPSKSTTGGALLGDRIRYNQIYNGRIFFRSLAARGSREISSSIEDSIAVLKSAGFDLIIVETPGIGQGDSAVVDIVDSSMYVMTAEFGAPSQLEKIDMLDKAEFIAINKFEKIGSEDAYREVMINFIRNRKVDGPMNIALEDMDLPVFACSSNQFNNPGVNRLFKTLLSKIESVLNLKIETKSDLIDLLPTKISKDFGLLDNKRITYLAEIAETVRNYHTNVEEEAQKAFNYQALVKSAELSNNSEIKSLADSTWENLKDDTKKFLSTWEETRNCYQQETLKYKIQSKEFSINLYTKSLSGTPIPKVAMPKFQSNYELTKFYYKENLPGYFPYTAGVFPFKRTTEDPRRQFAGEGGPERTNTRFHYLSNDDDAKRLSVAFDGITLYAEDPAVEPDVYGKIGESGVSICTVDDMDVLMKGFNLTDPLTSVSMTINAPAPIMVAFYFITAYKRELNKIESTGKTLTEEEKQTLKLDTIRSLRGTVQADMLKEDQGQNTCIFSIDFAMKLIGDLQEYLSKNRVKGYYSLSISGYHIAEAGANPITQLAFTLANGFTYVEYFLNRGLKIDEFAPNLSFFFSNGMDPEYSVIGRVSRRIWAVAMKNRYGANDSSQRLKYHIQTSGRSLHAQEIDFNDIRTTLQGLIAYYDNCNSLHTNSYDEAVTTPTEESVRRSIAIQMILSNEFGLLKNENPNQGSFILEELTDLVEEAVLQEFERLSRRGGVLGAMETQYQRSKIQEQSMYYEYQKQSGEYPIIGVNKFLRKSEVNLYEKMVITRASEEEKQIRLTDLNNFKERNKDKVEDALNRLRYAALTHGNVFEELLNTVEFASMGQITKVLYEIGGKYRRGM